MSDWDDEEHLDESDASEGDQDDGDDEWQYVEIPDLNQAGFRFRMLETGEVEVEVQHQDEIDEAPATWYARGYLECYIDMMGTIKQLMEGLPEAD